MREGARQSWQRHLAEETDPCVVAIFFRTHAVAADGNDALVSDRISAYFVQKQR
jgi:hypothetical protein